MNKLYKAILDKNYFILFIIWVATFFFACLNLYHVDKNYSSKISYSIQIKTSNNQFQSQPAIYFNNDQESPTIGKIFDNIIIFDNIPSSINTLRFSFMLPKETIVQISDINILLNCKDLYEKCVPIYTFNINNNFETWIKGGLKTLKKQIISDEPESILLWGQRTLNLVSIAEKQNYSVTKYSYKSIVTILLLLIISITFFICNIYLIRNNYKVLKNTIIAIGSFFLLSLYLTSAFPGHTNFDEYSSITEFWSGLLSDTHPPMQTLLWTGSIALSDFFGFSNSIQTSTLLFIILLIFLLSTYLIASELKSLKSVVILYLLFLLPFYLINIPHIGKDTILAISLLFSSVCLYYFNKKNNFLYIFFGLLFMIIAYGSRANAPAAVIPVIVYFAINLFNSLSKDNFVFIKKIAWMNKSYIFVPFISILIILIIHSSNLLINKIFIKNVCCAKAVGLMTPIHDLIGMSYYSQKLLVPKKYVKNPSTYLDHINKTYPTHFDFDGTKEIIPENTNDILSSWFLIIKENPYLYLEHRIDILKRFFGFTNKYNPYAYSTGFYFNNFHNKIMKNEKAYNKFIFITKIDQTLIKIQAAVRLYVSKFRNTVFFKPWFYILIASLSMLIVRKKNTLNQLAISMFLSSFFYLAPYLLVVNSASTRYAYWPILCTLFIFIIKLDVILNSRKKN